MTEKVRNTDEIVQMISMDPLDGCMYLVVGDGTSVDSKSKLYIKEGCAGRFTRVGVVEDLHPKFNDEPFEGYTGLEFRSRPHHFVQLVSKVTGQSVWLCNGIPLDTTGHEGRWEFQQQDDGDIMMMPAHC
jgi:hypothetical protein